jgi:excisionase family DNA binding protein
MKQVVVADTVDQHRGTVEAELFGEYPEVMNITQVSQALGVCTNTVRAMIYQHQIPAKKIGSKWHILRADLAAWVTASDN